jgi:phosphoglycolate phosphatase
MRLRSPAKLKFKAILFDKDGTLIDFVGTWLALFERFALEVAGGDPQEAARLLEIGGYHAPTGKFRAGSEIAAGTTGGIVALWTGHQTGSEFDNWKAYIDAACTREGPQYAVPVPGLESTLTHLHEQGLALAVVTNDVELAARRTVQRLSVDRFFSAVLGCDSVINPKPAADPVHLACELLGVLPHEAVVVGDNLHDIQMARNAGAGAAIAVLTGTTSREDFGDRPDAILPSIADLPDWLAANGN